MGCDETLFTVGYSSHALGWLQTTATRFDRKGVVMRGEPTTQEEPMTREELDAFSHKLEVFTDSLTPKERALLLQVLMRAGADEPEDVEAHEMTHCALAAAALALHLEWRRHPPIL